MTEYHGYVGEHCGMEIFRNPRRFQHAGNRWILFRTSNNSSDGFRTMMDALFYAKRLNPKMVWKKVTKNMSLKDTLRMP